MESLIAFADYGLGGFSWISTFSWLASSLRGSAGRCYKRFINKMKCNARKSYSCKMHFPSCVNPPHVKALSILLLPADPLLPSQLLFHPGNGKMLLSFLSHPTASKMSFCANNSKYKHLKRKEKEPVGRCSSSPASPALSQPFPRAKLPLAALATVHRLPALHGAGEETAAPKVSV